MISNEARISAKSLQVKCVYGSSRLCSPGHQDKTIRDQIFVEEGAGKRVNANEISSLAC